MKHAQESNFDALVGRNATCSIDVISLLSLMIFSWGQKVFTLYLDLVFVSILSISFNAYTNRYVKKNMHARTYDRVGATKMKQITWNLLVL